MYHCVVAVLVGTIMYHCVVVGTIDYYSVCRYYSVPWCV